MESQNPSQSPTASQPKVPDTTPQMDLLECIQRNMFSDAMLMSMGLRFMGSVMERHPEVNKPELYAKVEFGAGCPFDAKEFEIEASSAASFCPSSLISRYDEIVEALALHLRKLLEGRNSCPDAVLPSWLLGSRMVGGTLRLQLEIKQWHQEHCYMAEFTYIWVSQKVKE